MDRAAETLEFEIGQVVEAKGRQWYVAEKRDVSGENGVQSSVYRLKSISGVHAEWFVIPEIEALTHPMRVSKLPQPEPIIGHPFSQSLLVQAYRYTLRNDSLALTCLRNARVIPENYQLVPVLMALKQQDKVRMLIADGVGLGKTVEALLIVSELYNKEIAERILIVCPANIREQWRNSLKRFFNIDGVIVDSTSRRKLESQMMVDQNVWNYYDVVIVSIDYLKQIYVLGEVIQYKWDLAIIDEAHNCGMPHNYFRKEEIFGEKKAAGSVNLAKAQKYLALMNERYKKLNEKIKEKADGQMTRRQLENKFRPKQEKEAYEMALILASKVDHLLLLTATPHNGFTDSFGSLLHLLDEKCVRFDGTDVSINKEHARSHVCQRTYSLVKDEIENKDVFPEVDEDVVSIDINPEFKNLVRDIKDYCGCLIYYFKLHESDSKMKYPNMRIILNWIINNLHKRLISSPYALYASVWKMVKQKKEDVAEREAKKSDILVDWTIEDMGYEQDQITRNLFDIDVAVEENEDEVDEALVKNYVRVPLAYEKVSLPYLELLASNANEFMGKLGLVIQEVVQSMETEEMLGDDGKVTYADHLKAILKRHGIDLAQKTHRDTFKAKIINNLLDTKMKRLLTLIPEITTKAKSKKVIIFTRFIDTLSYIEFYLQIAKLLGMPFFGSTNVFSINGKQPIYVREQVYNDFRRADDGILVATDCMAEGIDLQYSANILINYELTWNPNRIEQRNGRINRFGQPMRTVYLRLLVLKHKIEQEILAIIKNKIDAMKNDIGLIPSFFHQTINLNESFEVPEEGVELLRRKDFLHKDKNDLMEQKQIDEYIDAAILASFQKQIGLADEAQMRRIIDESFYGQETVKISQVKEKMTEFTHRYGKPSELLAFLKNGIEKYGLRLEPVPEKDDVFKLAPGLSREAYDEFMDDLNVPKDQPVLVTTDPKYAARRKDIDELKLNSPVITALIDKLKRDCFSDQETFYGRVVVRGIPHDAFKSHVIELTVLYRFAVHMKKPVVFEELHQMAMQLRPESILDQAGLDTLHELKALNSTLADGEKCKAFIEQALKSPVLTGAIEGFKEKRRQELVKEREAFWNQLEATQVHSGEKDEFLDVRAPSWDVLTITLHTREISS